MTNRGIYGLRRLALLDSAGYDSAVIPLNSSIGLVAANNRGKTGLINALQFLFIPSRNRQDFVKYSREESQKFYFPSPWSYVLLELLTGDGAIVMGCVGRGELHAYDYSYFAYKGQLELTHFQTTDGAFVRGTELRAHMEQLGRQLFFYTRDDFRDQLFARGREPSPGEPDFGIFKLAPRIKPDLFQMIFGRVLRLDELNATAVKTNLIALYGDGLPQAMNFKQTWEASRHGVTAKQLLVDAAASNGEKIQRLAELQQERIRLRSEAVHFMSLIDTALEGWEEAGKRRKLELQGKLTHHRQEKEALENDNRKHAENLGEVKVLISRVEEEEEAHRNLAREFSVGDLSVTEDELKNEIARLSARNHLLQQRLNAARHHGLEVLTQELDSIVQRVTALEGQMRDDSLKVALHEQLPAMAADAITRVLAPEVLALGSERYLLDNVSALQAVVPSSVALSGLTVNVSDIPPHLHDTKEVLQRQLDLLRQKRIKAEEDLAAAKDLESKQKELDQGRESEEAARQRLVKFREWRDLENGATARNEKLADLRSRKAAIETGTTNAQRRIRELDSLTEAARIELNGFLDDMKSVVELMQSRLERSPTLVGMEKLETNLFHSSGLPKSIPRDQLRSTMEAQERRCNLLIGKEAETVKILNGLSKTHLSSLMEIGGTEEAIKTLAEYWENIDSERGLLRREEEQATAVMKSELDQLLKGLDVFKTRVSDFNGRIRRKPISDLEVFQITVVPDEALVSALDTVINAGGLFSAEYTGDLHASLELLNSQATLSFESLFSLQFEVKKRGHALKRHSSLQSAGSDGTTAMAKLVIGLAMLSMLRDRRRGSELRAACYLDEAARLDHDNQEALIEMASDMGFTLVMAAPSQLITPRWCIPVRSENGRGLILQSDWIENVPDQDMVRTPDGAEVEPA